MEIDGMNFEKFCRELRVDSKQKGVEPYPFELTDTQQHIVDAIKNGSLKVVKSFKERRPYKEQEWL